MGKPTVSVIIPVYNVEAYLRRCVDSVTAQTLADLEIFLVDDGSTDGSPALCDEYAAKDSRIRVIHKTNGGLGSARNAGLDAAAGETLAFIDSDDFIAVDMVETLLNALRKESADIAVCGFQRVDEQNRPEGEAGSFPYTVLSGLQALERLYTDDYIYFTIACNKLFKRSLFSSYRFPEGKLFEDGYAAFRCYYASRTVVCLPYTGYFYFTRSGSLTQAAIGVKNLDGIDADCDSLQFLIEKQLTPLVEKAQTKYAAAIINNLKRFDLKQPDVRNKFRQIRNDFRGLYPGIMKNSVLSKKEKLLLTVFRISPRLCKQAIKVKKL